MQRAWLPPAEGFVKEPQTCHGGLGRPGAQVRKAEPLCLGRGAPRECWEAVEQGPAPQECSTGVSISPAAVRQPNAGCALGR